MPQLSGIQPIKICHLSSVHFALDTRIFYRMCQSLAKTYQVTLIAVHPQEENIRGINIIPFKRFHNRRYRLLFSWFLMLFKALKVNAKVYHLHDPELIPCGIILRMLGKKVILDIHENIAEDIFDKPWIRNQRLAYNIFNFFEKIACKFFIIILAEKSYEKRYLKLGARFQTIQNFCDIEFFQSFAKTEYKNGLNLYYIGIILENRGILQIAQSIKLLRDEGYIANFHCVGELYSDLESKLKHLEYYDEISAQLHFYGRLPLEEGYKLVENMDIGMCIIWPMNNSRESYPTKLFEYMSCGLPIITSNFTLYKETIEGNNCGICVDPLDANEIKKAILTIHRDVKNSELMAKNGKIAVEKKYDWKSQISILSKVYEDILR